MLVTDEAPPRVPAARRYPLTLAAAAGSAVAIPLYMFMVPGATPHAQPVVDTAQVVEPTTAAQAVAVDESIEPADLVPIEAEAPAAAPGGGSPSTRTAKPARKTSPAKIAMDSRPKLALGLDGSDEGLVAGKGGGGGYGRGAGFGAKARRGPRASSAEEIDLPEADARMFDAKPKAKPEAAADFDEQLRAGRLTAGAIDDLQSTTSLDELREKATAQDTALAQIPSHQAQQAAPDPDRFADVLEIGFVLDTTGSMGDELQYLKTEIRSIAQEISREYPNVSQRYGLVAYRDQGDAYVVQHHDFAALDAFVDHLGAQAAGGGGDFPEAMDAGMRAASELQWSGAKAAKLVFLVADAPPHTQGYENYVQATGSLASKGVSVYPVASSGINPVCEYLMRWAARTTGGQYLFLTDHSGVGNGHADPHAASYELKSLRAHMLDQIRAELGSGNTSEGVAGSGSTKFELNVAINGEGSNESWMDRYGLLAMILGGMFLLGFAGDTVLSNTRRSGG